MQHTNDLITAYENSAQDRNASSTDHFKIAEQNEFLSQLKKEDRKTILEIGCGPGHDAKSFSDQGFDVLATDITPAMIELTAQKGIDAQVLDCYHIDQLDQTFDAVYSMNCLLHIPNSDIEPIFQYIAHCLDENGLFYLGLWGGKDFEGINERDQYVPKRFFSFRRAETLLSLTASHFTLEYYRRLRPGDGVYFFNSLILRKC